MVPERVARAIQVGAVAVVAGFQGINEDPVILAVSSEGTIRNAVGDTMKMELLKILKGEYVAPHISIFYYRLDKIEEVADPAMWVKAQPNIGITVRDIT